MAVLLIYPANLVTIIMGVFITSVLSKIHDFYHGCICNFRHTYIEQLGDLPDTASVILSNSFSQNTFKPTTFTVVVQFLSL